MQIDRYSHLQFPLDNAANATGRDATSTAPGATAGKSQPRPAVLQPQQPASVRTESVVLKIQWPDGPSIGTLPGDAPVYSKASTAVTTPDTLTPDSQLQDHLRAVDRNAGVFTKMSVSKDGVLVATPQPATQAKAPDFVALAVSAMREFSDENDRQKARASAESAAQAPTPEPARGALKGLQQLAAKFNVFA